MHFFRLFIKLQSERCVPEEKVGPRVTARGLIARRSPFQPPTVDAVVSELIVRPASGVRET